jgi:hypothetical protein
MELSAETVSIIVGLGLANIAAIVGNYVSTKVSVAKLEVLVGKLEKDVDNLGRMYRDKFNNKERKEI